MRKEPALTSDANPRQTLLPPTFNTQRQIWRSAPPTDSRKRTKAAFVDQVIPPVCDLGESNRQKQILEHELKIKIESNFGFDFNSDSIPGKWGTIFCLEILEHVLNPLLFLQNIRKALSSDGILYLSTPCRPRFLWTEHHYHEIDDERMAWLFDWHGVNLEIERMKRIRLFYGWKWHLRGVRPMLRLNTFTRIYKLRRV